MSSRGWVAERALLVALAAWLITGFAHAAAPAAPTTHLDYAVQLDPATRVLRGRGTVATTLPGEAVVSISTRFAADRVVIDGKPAGTGVVRGDRRIWRIAPAPGRRVVEVEWHGTLAPLDTSLDHRQTLVAGTPVAGPEGSLLLGSAGWYPAIEGQLASYRIALELPGGQRGLVAGRLVEETTPADGYRATFEFPFPSEGIDLMAGPYRVDARSVRAASGRTIRLATYFHSQIADLSAGYLDAVKGYLDLYETWIGEYPFTEFSVVSSPTPTGFGMPTLTYLGIDVLRLPFIRTTSLGHEVLHNWWGNGVYPDYARGNWSEGLTTFMADYAYKEREGAEAAREMRLGWLRDFAAVPTGRDQPLVRFTSRTHGTSQIVGYNKAAMTFFMLRDLIGAEAFDRGIREFWRANRFATASWADLRRAFESASGHDLGAFFDQWLERTGAPSVRIENASAARLGEGWRVTFGLVQTAPAYRLRVPVSIRTETGQTTQGFDLWGPTATFTVDVPARPIALALDPEVQLFRRLGPDEAPPIFRQAGVDPATTTVLLAATEPARTSAMRLAARLQDHAPRVVAASQPAPRSPLLVLGLHEEIDAWLARNGLPPRPASLAGRGTAQAWTQARPGAGPLFVVSAADADALSALARPLPHYGRQSFVVFDGARAIDRGVWSTAPQTVDLR